MHAHTNEGRAHAGRARVRSEAAAGRARGGPDHRVLRGGKKTDTATQTKGRTRIERIYNKHRANIQQTQSKHTTDTEQILNRHRTNIKQTQNKYKTYTERTYDKYRTNIQQIYTQHATKHTPITQHAQYAMSACLSLL